MKKLYSLFSVLLLSILCNSQTQNISITGPSQTSGPVVVTLEINAPTVCSVIIVPTGLSIQTNNTQQFTATTTGCTPSTVSWQVNGINGGDATHGTVDGTGLYTAPNAVPTPATVTVTAVSDADNTKTASATVVITAPPPPCSVSISPTSSSLLVGGTQQFTPTTQSCTPSTVHWQVNNVTGGNSTVGTITTGGLYTAPTNVPTPNVVTVKDVSDQDNTTNATASVIISAPLVCSVSLTPLLSTVNVGQTQQFKGTSTNCSPGTTHWLVNNINGGNSTVGTVDSTGLFTAPVIVPTPNVVTLTVVSDADVIKIASASITITTVPISAMDKYELIGDVCTFGAFDSFAQLPLTCYYTDPSVTTSTGTIRNATAATWNTVWTATQCNDIVEITAGTTIVGNFTIPTKICTKNSYITLRTSAHSSLPPYGTKVTPCYANIASLPDAPIYPCSSPSSTLAIIQGTGAGASTPLTVATNTAYLKIEGLELTRSAGTGELNQLFNPNTGGVNHLILDHVWLRGTTNDETKNGFTINRLNSFAFLDGFSYDIHCISVTGNCTDAKVIGGGTNTVNTDTDHTFKIVNNFLSASGENTLLGGAAASIVPVDFEYRNNYFYKSQNWNPSSPTYNGGVSGHPYIVKNLFELKTGRRILFEGNTLENLWAGFTQQAFAVLLNPKNQGGTQCPICEVSDVTIRYNKIKTSWSTYQIANISDTPGTFAIAGFNYSIHDNNADNLQYSTCFKCTQSTSSMIIDNTLNAPSSFILNHVNFNHNTYVYAGGSTTYAGSTIGMSAAVSPNNENFILFQNNLMSSGFFFFGTNNTGTSTSCSNAAQVLAIFNACWNNNVITGNTILPPIIQRSGGAWTPHVTTPPTVSYTGSTFTFPVQTCLTETSQTSIFVNYNNGLNGDYHVKNTSSCHNMGNDGTDPGANQDLVNTLTQTSTQF